MQRVQRYVARRVSNPADAADIVQESMMRVIERSREVEIVRPDFYALTVAGNLLNDRHRAGSMAVMPLDDDLVCPLPRADQILSDRQRLEAFNVVLAAMPPLRREVFVRRRIDGESREEIASALGLEVEAVKKHISRALAQLARALAALESPRDGEGEQG